MVVRRSAIGVAKQRLRAAARDWLGPATGTGTARWLRRLVLLLAAGHLVFGAGRLFYAGYGKRLQEASDWHRLGEVGYQFRDTDAETRRIASWLCDAVPRDQVVLYTGEDRGYLQILAAVLAPRLLVRASGVPPAARRVVGRPIFAGHPPWMEVDWTVPVVEGCVESLRLLGR